MAMTIVEATRPVTGGVDTHLDTHVAAVIDSNGGLLGVETFPTTPAGLRNLHDWMTTFGEIDRVGIEGTGAYGAGLARHFRARGVEVIEADRPNRQVRHRAGKSDTIDAIEAARGALSGRLKGIAKTSDGNVEAIRVLVVAKRSARETRVTYMNQIRHLGFTGPQELRERFRHVSREALAQTAAGLRPNPNSDPVLYATKLAIRTLGRRVLALDDDIHELDGLLAELVAETAPSLLDLYGVGADTAAILLVAAGDNSDRIRTEAAFARLCGAAPIPTGSGKTGGRYRLNPGGNRQANNALWRIAITRMSSDPRTRAYVERRLAEGLSKREIIRCLKRYIAREVYAHLPR